MIWTDLFPRQPISTRFWHRVGDCAVNSSGSLAMFAAILRASSLLLAV
jgi:hypothetical protein